MPKTIPKGIIEVNAYFYQESPSHARYKGCIFVDTDNPRIPQMDWCRKVGGVCVSTAEQY